MKDKVGTLMACAAAFGANSTSTRLSVGAVIATPRGVIISTGYNGSLPETDNCLEDENGVTKVAVIHAEMNAIYHAARRGLTGLQGMHLYCTHAPCEACATAIIMVGIKRVIYEEPYRITTGVDLLSKHLDCTRYMGPLKDHNEELKNNSSIRLANTDG